MIEQLKTLREGLALISDTHVHTYQKTLTALAQIEAMVGEPWLDERGYTLAPLHTAAPVAQQYEAGDMASAAAQGFRDGVASVAQPQEPVAYYYQKHNCFGQLVWNVGFVAPGDATHCYPLYTTALVAQQPQTRPDFTDEWTGYLKDGETPFERFLRERKDLQSVLKLYQRVLEENERLKGQQPQAKPDIHEAQGQIEFLDRKNNALSAAIRKVMARLADLLDEDQFKEIEETISSAGVQPQAEAVQCSVNSVSSRMCEKGTNGCDTQHAPQQAEAVPLTHVLVPVDEPTDEMVDAACAAVDGLCRVDFVRAYVAAFAHLKAGYRDESYWCGWNAAIKFQQAESAHQYNLANRLRVHLANRHTLTGPEFKDGVAGILAEYYTAPQQAEAVPTFDEQLREVAKRAIPQQAEAVPFNHATQLQIAYVKGLGDGAMQAEAVPPDVEVIRKALERAFIMGQNYWADADSESYSANKRSDVTRQKFNAMRDEVCAAIAQQKGQRP